jgi:multisubunit Na+/H+ antiporter MnhG subunit
MDTVALLIAILAVVLGTLFSIVGVLGFIRFPDVYTRLHATGKVGVFGVVLLLIAVVVWEHLSSRFLPHACRSRHGSCSCFGGKPHRPAHERGGAR